MLVNTSLNEQAILGYKLNDGLLLYKERLYVGSNTGLKQKLLELYHATALGGHSGINATRDISFGQGC